MPWCSKCGEWFYTYLGVSGEASHLAHACPPRFDVWEMWGDDPLEDCNAAREVLARSPEQAAILYRQRHDDFEAEDHCRLAVRNADGVISIWDVERRLEPVYRVVRHVDACEARRD